MTGGAPRASSQTKLEVSAAHTRRRARIAEGACAVALVVLGAYCTRVGLYRPGVVRAARDPDLRGVHPNAGQWHPTLVQ